jgi:hypothetical protein
MEERKELEEFLKILRKIFLRQNPFVKEILENVKTDEEFFHEFLNFVEKNYEKREIILLALKRIVFESAEKIMNT